MSGRGPQLVAVLALALAFQLSIARADPPEAAPYVTELFGVDEPREAVLAARRIAEEKARARARERNDWCGFDELERGSIKFHDDAYFEANTSRHQQAVSRCRGRAMPSATREATEMNADSGMHKARPALEKCLKAARLDAAVLAIEINPATGGVSAAHVVNGPSKQLDRCVAAALASACFEPGQEDEMWRPIFAIQRPLEPDAGPKARAQRDYAWRAAPQRLAPVSSICPPLPASTEPSVLSYDEVLYAFSEATPDLQGCLRRAGILTENVEVAINVHAPSGRVAGAAAVVHPKRPLLDACIASVLKTMCFYPFDAPPKFSPYYGARAEIWRIQNPPPYRFPEIASTCAARPSPPGRESPSFFDIDSAIAPAVPAIQRCLEEEGFRPNFKHTIEVDIDAATGGFRAASVEIEERDPSLDACVATALKDACVLPFHPNKGEKLARRVLAIDPASPNQTRLPAE
jgi:hypothetical protein